MRVGWCAVKAGPFHEHSNQLWNISGVPNWPKVYSGKILIQIDKSTVVTFLLLTKSFSLNE
jgi:hypothetical protein